MRSIETRKTVSHTLQPQQAHQPFFRKSGEAGLFAKAEPNIPSFFNPQPGIAQPGDKYQHEAVTGPDPSFLQAGSSPRIQCYRDENDQTVFQENCPLTLFQLLQVFILNQENIEFQVTNREGERQTVRFTRDWVYSPQGIAILRGRIRYEFSQEIGGRGEALLEAINGLSGNPERIQELREDYEIARSRNEEDAERARSSGAHLVEVAQGEGTSWNERAHLGGALHAAWDLAAPRNTGVYAPVAGIVVKVTRTAGYGNRIKILHPNGPDLQGRSRPVYTNYCHLDEVLVSERSAVHPGQAVGLIGNTRFDDRGITTIQGIRTHLHFSVQRAARNVVDEDGNINWDRVNTTLTSQYERDSGIHPQPWFNAVTGSEHPYRTRTPEATSADQSREVHELEALGIPRESLRRRSGTRGSYTYHPANIGTISGLPPTGQEEGRFQGQR